MAYYKPEFKELVVKKYLAGADKKSLAIEYNLLVRTIDNWIKTLAPKSSSQDTPIHRRSLAEQLKALEEIYALSAEDKVLYCRQHGLYLETLAQWRQDIINGDTKNALAVQEKNKIIKAQCIELERQTITIARKDKALTEAAEILLLKKKVALYWEEKEGD